MLQSHPLSVVSTCIRTILSVWRPHKAWCRPLRLQYAWLQAEFDLDQEEESRRQVVDRTEVSTLAGQPGG